MKSRARPVILTMALILTACVLSGMLTGALDHVFGGVFEWTASLTRPEPSRDALLEENRRLLEETARLRSELADYEDIKRENERLLGLFDSVRDKPSLSLKPAAVLRRDAGDDFAAFTLGVGSSDGVEEGDPVITSQGLIGRVTRVYSASCRVATVLSPELMVSVTEKSSGERGVLSGDSALCGEGLTGAGLFEAPHRLSAGDHLYTSGDGGAYPKNLYVGRVREVRQDSVTVEPCEDCFAVDYAAAVTDFSGKGEVSRVN